MSDHRTGPRPDDIPWLSLFIVTLKQRTPEGREQLHQADIRMAEMMAEVNLSDPEVGRNVAGWSADETERQRITLLDDLRKGKLIFESTPSREVALMFMAVQQGAEFLGTEMRWTQLLAPEGRSFVLSDHPVAHYDATPKMPGAGASFASSPNSQTLIPLDPHMALLLEPADELGCYQARLTPDEVDEANLLIYAQARNYVYGPTQAVVAGVRRLAKQNPAARSMFARRPPRLWVTEVDADSEVGGVRTFTSTYKGVTMTRELYVPPEAEREGRKRAWPPRKTASA